MFKRLIHTSARVTGPRTLTRTGQGPRPPFRTPQDGKKSLDKNIPMFPRVKAWEKMHMDKEQFFKKKYARQHYLEKQRESKRPQRRERQIDDDKEPLRRHEMKRFERNPLVDYVYGINPVLAALRGNLRSDYGKLYIHGEVSGRIETILKVAEEKGVEVVEQCPKQDLNQMTANGVHNGVVLETRPLLLDSIPSLGTNFDELTTDDRNPFGVYLDEISDPHNVGAIIRSAYFLGADFIIFSEKNCASLTPLVCKASSGAVEFIPISTTSKPLQFFDETAKNGWNIVSAVAPSQVSHLSPLGIVPEELPSLLEEKPMLLVLGSEGTGIRKNLINRSSHVVGLSSGRKLDNSVDSLNVSVAAALLMQQALQ